MSNHTTTLRNIIFHYSQDNNPLHPQEEKRYAFIRLEDEMGVMERIEKARSKMLYNTNNFFNEEFKNAFFQQFCVDNMMRISIHAPAKGATAFINIFSLAVRLFFISSHQ